MGEEDQEELHCNDRRRCFSVVSWSFVREANDRTAIEEEERDGFVKRRGDGVKKSCSLSVYW